MYKDLMLNRDKIQDAIEAYCEENYDSHQITYNDYDARRRYNIEFDAKKMFLDVFYNKKGGTTLQVSNGKHPEEKEKLAKFLSTSPLCVMASEAEHNRSILFKNIELDDFEHIINIIKDEGICKSISPKENNDKSIIYKLIGQWDDKIAITYYKSRGNVRLQGRPLLLFSFCSSLFNELLDENEVIPSLNEAYGTDISYDAVEEQYKKLLPYSYDKHPDNLKNSLLKSVYNLNVPQQPFTCTELVFEVLRALEGHIKLTLLRDYGVRSPNKHGTLTFFEYDRQNSTVSIKLNLNDDIAEYYKNTYKYYADNRHQLFHWDYPDSIESDTTVQIEDVKDAREIIIDALHLIDDYYKK